MVTKSGIILDYDTNEGVSGALLHVYTSTGTTLLTSTGCSPIGTFTVTIPDSVDSDLIYVPLFPNKRGYTRQLSKNNNFINLYLRNVSGVPDIENLNLSLHNTGLVTSLIVRDIISSPTHYYVVTDNGLDIIDVNTLFNVGYITRSGGFTSIALDRTISTSSGVYLGTTNSGVYKFNIPATYNINNRDISSLLSSAYSVQQSNLLSNTVQCLHINKRGELAVGTPSGIDFLSISGRRSHSYNTWSGTSDVFVSDYGDLYYSPTGSGLHVKYAPIAGNWVSPDYYIILSGTGPNAFPLLSNYINDIAVTSVSGDTNNHVFLATQSGLMFFQEDANLNTSAANAKLIRSFP